MYHNVALYVLVVYIAHTFVSTYCTYQSIDCMHNIIIMCMKTLELIIY